jgi:hypothetical protein
MIWLGVAIVLVVAGAVVGRSIFRAKTSRTPVAAYLIPIANNNRVKPAWWHSVRLDVPRALRSGERISIPAGTSLKLIHADSGAVELVTGPTNPFLQQKLPSEPDALVSPLPEILEAVNKVNRTDSAVIITSPVGLTRYLNPLITWTAREGVTYDIAVTDAADAFVPPRIALGVRPPIALADLETPQRRQLGVDRNYEIRIREANASTIAAGTRLLTTTDAQLENQLPCTPVELIAEAAAALARKPYRTGDAWLALSHLPPDWARSELGVRLRLRVAVELGLTDELNRALTDARHL